MDVYFPIHLTPLPAILARFCKKYTRQMRFLCKNTAFLPIKPTIHTANSAKTAIFAEFTPIHTLYPCKNRPFLRYALSASKSALCPMSFCSSARFTCSSTVPSASSDTMRTVFFCPCRARRALAC